MIMAYIAYGVCTLALGVGIGFLVAKITDIFETKKMVKDIEKEIEDRR